MKIWYQHGSEHSADLVMIGRFENAAEASKAKEIIDTLTNHVRDEESSCIRTVGQPSDRYGNAMLDLLGRLNILSISPRELEQFLYEVSVKVDGKNIILTTEEVEISAFLKILFDQGARIEIYSAHDHPDSEYGRGRR
jgi:hypothetical protein